MNHPLIHCENPVTLIGGGSVGVGDLDLVLAHAPLLVAADGGAGKALAAGHDPAAVIGDFDSLAAADRARIPESRLFPITEQDSTDFDKALRHISAPLVLAVGFLGGRIDHQLAAFNTLIQYGDRPCILLGQNEVIFHAPPVLDLDLVEGDIVSLFPMARLSGRSRGLQWPIDGLDFEPGRRVGTSNRALGSVHIEMDKPGMLMIVPRARIDTVIRSVPQVQVTDQTGDVPRPPNAHWPVRA